MARPAPWRVRLADGPAVQQRERSDGKEAIQTRVKDIGCEEQAQRPDTRGTDGTQATTKGHNQRLGG
jgi:hypothetical protein